MKRLQLLCCVCMSLMLMGCGDAPEESASPDPRPMLANLAQAMASGDREAVIAMVDTSTASGRAAGELLGTYALLTRSMRELHAAVEKHFGPDAAAEMSLQRAKGQNPYVLLLEELDMLGIEVEDGRAVVLIPGQRIERLDLVYQDDRWRIDGEALLARDDLDPQLHTQVLSVMGLVMTMAVDRIDQYESYEAFSEAMRVNFEHRVAPLLKQMEGDALP